MIVTRAVHICSTCPPKLTHNVIAEDKESEGEDERKVDLTMFDVEEINDIALILI